MLLVYACIILYSFYLEKKFAVRQYVMLHQQQPHLIHIMLIAFLNCIIFLLC